MGSSLDAMLSISIFSLSWARRDDDERDIPRSMASGEAILFAVTLFIYGEYSCEWCSFKTLFVFVAVGYVKRLSWTQAER